MSWPPHPKSPFAPEARGLFFSREVRVNDDEYVMQDSELSQFDHLVELTDNSTTEEDGPQDDVDQSPIGEDDVFEDVTV